MMHETNGFDEISKTLTKYRSEKCWAIKIMQDAQIIARIKFFAVFIMLEFSIEIFRYTNKIISKSSYIYRYFNKNRSFCVPKIYTYNYYLYAG